MCRLLVTSLRMACPEPMNPTEGVSVHVCQKKGRAEREHASSLGAVGRPEHAVLLVAWLSGLALAAELLPLALASLELLGGLDLLKLLNWRLLVERRGVTGWATVCAVVLGSTTGPLLLLLLGLCRLGVHLRRCGRNDALAEAVDSAEP